MPMALANIDICASVPCELPGTEALTSPFHLLAAILVRGPCLSWEFFEKRRNQTEKMIPIEFSRIWDLIHFLQASSNVKCTPNTPNRELVLVVSVVPVLRTEYSFICVTQPLFLVVRIEASGVFPTEALHKVIELLKDFWGLLDLNVKNVRHHAVDVFREKRLPRKRVWMPLLKMVRYCKDN